MALVDLKDDGNGPKKTVDQSTLRKAADTHKTIATESNQIDSTAISLFQSGSTWNIQRYYQQILKHDDEPAAQDLNRDAVYQQYNCIKDLPLKVSQALTYDADEQVRAFNGTGAAGMFAAVVPNPGDMFIADVGTGRYGVFTLTSARRSSIQKNSVYQIEYKQVSWLNEEREADFARKTVSTYVFDANGLLEGCGPLVSEETIEQVKDYSKVLYELLDAYLADFYSPENGTLLVPDQEQKTYDHFVTKFVLTIIDRLYSPRLGLVRVMNVDADQLISRSNTVWDAMLHRREFYLTSGIKDANLTDMRGMRGRPELQAIGYMGIPYIVYPVDHSTNVEDRYDKRDIKERFRFAFRPGKVRRRDRMTMEAPDVLSLPEFQWNPKETGISQHPLIKPVTCDTAYVFSEDFYQANDNQSQLEYLVNLAIQRKEVDAKILNTLIKNPLAWTSLERFYYFPALFYLLLIFIRRQNG